MEAASSSLGGDGVPSGHGKLGRKVMDVDGGALQ